MTQNLRTALVTGASGFIGFHLCLRLLRAGWRVIGVDCLSDYYDVQLKQDRQSQLTGFANFTIINDRVEAGGVMTGAFAAHRPDIVVHLAAQAGVRHSIDHPRDYVSSNIIGTFEMLEAARAHPPAHMLMASTSSVFGANVDMPYGEAAMADHQMSFYAASKKAGEVMAHSYAHLFDLPITMFRFFTVYGPWGRPDMAPYKFTKAILNGTPIDIYNHGDLRRDFTYIDDLVTAIVLLMDAAPARPVGGAVPSGDSLSPVAPWRVVNIGNSETVELLDFISAIEGALGRKAQRNLLPMQPGDVPATWADASLLRRLTGYAPKTKLQDGIKAYIDWHKGYYGG